MTNNKVLEANNLTLAWDGSIIVDDATLYLSDSEIVCLVGKSGCGKTTLFHALAGLTIPVSGDIVLEGKSCVGDAGSISYMLQKDLLLPSRTIIDNVCLPLLIAGMSKTDAYAKANPLFDRFGLEGTQDKWPSQLSGGMRQRAALLRTYLMDNRVVLLDEPFSALDALTRSEIRLWFCSMIKELGMSALLITHDVDEVVALSDRIYVMRGNPSQHIPSTIADCITIERKAGYEGFDLTPEFLDYKKQVLSLLS